MRYYLIILLSFVGTVFFGYQVDLAQKTAWLRVQMVFTGLEMIQEIQSLQHSVQPLTGMDQCGLLVAKELTPLRIQQMV